jgi:hypothetical protein
MDPRDILETAGFSEHQPRSLPSDLRESLRELREGEKTKPSSLVQTPEIGEVIAPDSPVERHDSDAEMNESVVIPLPGGVHLTPPIDSGIWTEDEDGPDLRE